MVGDLIICLLAFFNIFIYLFVFILKKEGSRKGSRRGSKKGSKKGVQKGGSTFCLRPPFGTEPKLTRGGSFRNDVGNSSYTNTVQLCTCNTLLVYISARHCMTTTLSHLIRSLMKLGLHHQEFNSREIHPYLLFKMICNNCDNR